MQNWPIFRNFVPSNMSNEPFHLYAKQSSTLIQDPCSISSVRGSHGARTAVLPLHPAALSLAETKAADARRSGSIRLRQAATTNLASIRSQHYLPTFRPPVSGLFLCLFGPQNALELSSEETPTFIGGNPHFPRSKIQLSKDPLGAYYHQSKKYKIKCRNIASLHCCIFIFHFIIPNS